jgi:aspartokinase
VQSVPDALARTVATAAAVRADVLLVSQASAHNDICLVVASSAVQRTVEALRHEFSPDLMREKVGHTVFDSAVSVITLVGQNLRTAPGTVARTFAALGQENVDVIATMHGSSDCSMSFVVSQSDTKIALASLHRELELSTLSSTSRRASDGASQAAIWKCEPEQATAD